MIQAIIFDFDGVIVDSNPIKKNAYFIIFSKIKGSREPIEEVILENPRKTRYGVIEEILKKLRDYDLMHFDNLKEEIERYVSMYGETTEKETTKAREINGAEQSLRRLSQKYPLFILTSTIQKSIDKIVGGRRLKKYFKGVYGANSSDYDKPQTLEKIAREYGFNPEKSVFIGDGKADYECARYFGMPFIGILNETNDFAEREDIKYKLYDLTRLPETVERIEKEIEKSIN